MVYLSEDKEVIEYMAGLKRDQEMEKTAKALKEKRGESLYDSHQVRTLTEVFLFYHDFMKLLFCLVGKSMTSLHGITILFRSFQPAT